MKTLAIVQAAGRLVDIGVRHARDVEPDSVSQKFAYVGVQGLAHVTWQYLLMLVGKPGVKADTWICRFVGDALSRPVTSSEAERPVLEAAGKRGVLATDLDHAIWSHMSRQAGVRSTRRADARA